MLTLLLSASSTHSSNTMAKKGKLRIEWRRGLIPLSLLIMFVLTFYFKVDWWILGLFVMWIPIYYLAYPWYLRRKWAAFEKEFAARFQKRDYRGLLELYRKQWFLKKFGPKPEMLSKLSLIYSGMEKYRDAEQVLERAIDLTPTPYRDRLYFNLANVKYELGKYDEAEHLYKALKNGSPYAHSVRAQLALIDVHQGREANETRELLENELKNATGVLRSRIEEALAKIPSEPSVG